MAASCTTASSFSHRCGPVATFRYRAAASSTAATTDATVAPCARAACWTCAAAAAAASAHAAEASSSFRLRNSANLAASAAASRSSWGRRISADPTDSCANLSRAEFSASWWADCIASSSHATLPPSKAAAYAASACSTAALFSPSATLCHVVVMAGTAPSLIAFTYETARAASAAPLSVSAPIRFGAAFRRTWDVRASKPARNSGRSRSGGTSADTDTGAGERRGGQGG